MTDTFARMRQIIGTTAEWTSNDIVLGYGEVGIERLSATDIKAKVGDGTAKWSALPYLSASDTVINSATKAALDAKLPKAGGTMTGPLVLAGDGASGKDAVTYTQLQAEVTRLTAILNGMLPIAGGTMGGTLTLAHDANNNLEAVTLAQLQKAISGVSSVTSGSLVFAGTVDMTAAFAMPSPAPTGGNFYTVTKAGAVDPSWSTHLANSGLSTVSIGDYVVWNAATSKFHHVSNAASLATYVPLTGTAQMSGDIHWSGAADNKKGASIISGKGGSIDDTVIDAGAY